MKETLERSMMFLKNTELQNYIEYRKTFEPEEVMAAVAEIQRRGKIFTETELAEIRKDLHKLSPEEIAAKNKLYTGMAGWRRNIIRDPLVDALILYPRFVIYLYSVLFTALFGAIMLAMNIRRTEEKNGDKEVIAFGAFCTGLELLFVYYFPALSAFALLFNAACALILSFIFWKKYIGNDTRYKMRLYFVPLLIGIGIYALLILILFIKYRGVLS